MQVKLYTGEYTLEPLDREEVTEVKKIFLEQLEKGTFTLRHNSCCDIEHALQMIDYIEKLEEENNVLSIKLNEYQDAEEEARFR